ncbi:aspartate kinase [Candidatus Woesearchaeota archaeon]|nr:aspartate kinase [Candidatus Woesearchaeota archaeon]
MFNVYKFGGSSVGSSRAIEASANLIQADPYGKVVVVSAPSGVTDLLLAGDKHHVERGEFPVETFRKIRDRFAATYEGISAAQRHIEVAFSQGGELERRIAHGADLTQQNAPYHTARLASFGEALNHELFALCLQSRGIAARAAPMERLMKLKGKPTCAEYSSRSDTRIQNYVNDGFEGVTVFGGYYGFDAKGNHLIFDRGGSDLSQTLIMRAIRAERGFNCTDSEGVRPIDPRLLEGDEFRDLPTLNHISYDMAQEIARAGGKILHPRCLDPLREVNIPLVVMNTFNPTGGRTQIDGETPQSNRIVAIGGKAGPFHVLRLRTGGMDGVAGYMHRVTGALRKVNTEMIATSDVTITAIHSPPSSSELLKIIKLQRYGSIDTGNSTALVALVGSGFTSHPELYANALTTLGTEKWVDREGATQKGIPVRAVSNAHDNSIWFAVPQDLYKKAAVALYRDLIKNN